MIVEIDTSNPLEQVDTEAEEPACEVCYGKVQPLTMVPVKGKYLTLCPQCLNSLREILEKDGRRVRKDGQ